MLQQRMSPPVTTSLCTREPFLNIDTDPLVQNPTASCSLTLLKSGYYAALFDTAFPFATASAPLHCTSAAFGTASFPAPAISANDAVMPA